VRRRTSRRVAGESGVDVEPLLHRAGSIGDVIGVAEEHHVLPSQGHTRLIDVNGGELATDPIVMDAGGTRWLELDLPALVREQRFLEVGA